MILRGRTGAPLTPIGLGFSPLHAGTKEESMEYRYLGRSGLKVSVLTMGTMTFGGSEKIGNTSPADAARLYMPMGGNGPVFAVLPNFDVDAVWILRTDGTLPATAYWPRLP